MTTEIKLGYRVKDLVSGITGIATSKVEYLNGCIHFCVVPHCAKDKKHEHPEGIFIDWQQLKFINEGIRDDYKPAEWNPRFELGNKVECQVTGYRGIITARYTSYTGTVELCVTPRSEDKIKIGIGKYIPREYLQLISKGITDKIAKDEGPGGPSNEQPERTM